ncbi:helix-turn-helix domain-containing protein [Vibrio sp. 10N.261.51.F12]|uniref:helix-turn-helix domain-containing protein n=1 Tax=Vibrio sp. 10N.261.51.F12 TaxID=3229679 RepID=UPI0035525C5A
MTEKYEFPSTLSVHQGWQKILSECNNIHHSAFLRTTSNGRLHLHDLRRLLTNLCHQTKDNIIPMRVAQHVTPLTFGCYSLALWTAPNLKSLLKNAADYCIVVASPIRLQYKEDKQGNAELWVLDSEPFNQESRVTYLGITLLICTLVSIIRQVTKNETLPITIKLNEPIQSDAYTEQLKLLTQTTIFNGTPVRKICVDKSYLNDPIPTHDKALYFATLTLVRKESEALETGDLILRIYNALNNIERLENLSGSGLASALNMNIRTLNRKLYGLNTSYRGVLEKYKLEKSLHLLEDANNNLTEIAYQLGFSDLSTFSRAFKRWTGQSPIKFRQQNI